MQNHFYKVGFVKILPMEMDLEAFLVRLVMKGARNKTRAHMSSFGRYTHQAFPNIAVEMPME